MIFALGFLCAGLLTLLFLPAFWRRASRLSMRRLEMQLPLSMTELFAERDALRAEFAAERRALEQVNERIGAAHARDRIALGESVVAIDRLQAQLGEAQADIASLRRESAAFQRDAHEAGADRATTEKALWDAEAQLAQRTDALRALSNEHAALGLLADERRSAIAGLETRVESLLADVAALGVDKARAEGVAQEKESQRAFLADEAERLESDLRKAQARRESMQADLDARAARLTLLDEQTSQLRREVARLTRELADTQRAQSDAQQRIGVLQADMQRQADRAATRLAEQTALAARAQATLAGLQQEQAAHDVRLLRQTIVDIGDEVARLAEALQRQGGDAAGGADLSGHADLSEKMRALQRQVMRVSV